MPRRKWWKRTISAGYMLVVVVSTFLIGFNPIISEALPAGLVQVNEPGKDSFNEDMLVVGNNVYVAWAERNPVTFDEYDVLFRKSTDGGVTFGPIVKIISNSLSAFRIELAANDNFVYMVWYGAVEEDERAIFFARSVDGGETFEDPIALIGNPQFDHSPHIAVSGEHVYVVWEEYLTLGTNIPSAVFFRVSHDNGANFEPIVTLSLEGPSGAGGQAFPEIAAFESDLYVFWQQTFEGCCIGTALRISHDNGNSFGPVKNLGGSNTGFVNPVILVSGKDIYFAVGGPAEGVQFLASHDKGDTFSTPITLGPGQPSETNMHIAKSGDDIYVDWSSSSGIIPNEVLLAVSHNDGVSFSEVQNISETPGISFFQDLAVKDGKLYIYWTDNINFYSANFDIFFRTSDDKGDSFGDMNTVTDEGTFLSVDLEVTDNGLVLLLRSYSTTESAIFVLPILDINHPPLAFDESFVTMKDIAAIATLAASDFEEDSLEFEVMSPPENGALSELKIIDPHKALVVYTPNPDFVGIDSFTFRANDGIKSGEIATITFQVFGSESDVCRPELATVIGTEDDDFLAGTRGDDIIMGLGGNDRIRGITGNDIICGGDGDDVIIGGKGNDVIFGGNGSDHLFGSEDNDLLVGGEGDDNISGIEGNDVLVGGDGFNKISGGNGEDTIIGGNGKDHIVGGGGSDIINSGGGNDYILGGGIFPPNTGPDGDDEIIGGDGNDIINGNEGTDSCTEGEILTNCEK